MWTLAKPFHSGCAQELSDEELRQREVEVEAALSQRYRTDRGFGVSYDRAACSAINPLSSEVVKVKVLIYHLYQKIYSISPFLRKDIVFMCIVLTCTTQRSTHTFLASSVHRGLLLTSLGAEQLYMTC